MPRITNRIATKAKPPAQGYVVHWDAQVHGFGLRVTAGGARAFIVQYRVRGNRRVRKTTLGPAAALSVKEARNMAREWLTRAWRGEDPAPRSQSITVEQLVSLYRARHLPTKKPRSQEEDQRMLNGDVLPVLGKRRLDEVTQTDVERLIGRVLARSANRTPTNAGTIPGGYQANRTRALLSCLFSLAQRWGLAENNPAEHVARNREKARERLLNDAEMAALGESAGRSTLPRLSSTQITRNIKFVSVPEFPIL